MQFFLNPLLALSLAGFAIIFSTASPVITHKPIPVSSPTTSSYLPPTPVPTLSTSVNATSTSLIATTITNPGIPLYPSTIKDQSPTTLPHSSGGGCEYPHFSPSFKISPSFDIYLSFGTEPTKYISRLEMMKHIN